MKICLLGAELFHADGQTGRHNGANSSFAILRSPLLSRHKFLFCVLTFLNTPIFCVVGVTKEEFIKLESSRDGRC